MTIASPADAESLRDLMHTSITIDSPFAIRYPRGKSNKFNASIAPKILAPGKGKKMTDYNNAKIAILTIGPVLKNGLEAAKELHKEGKDVNVFDMIWLKPLDKELIKEISAKYDAIITIEDGALSGGLGAAVNNYVKSLDNRPEIVNLGIPDEWIMHGSIHQLQEKCGFDINGIKKTVNNLHNKISKK